VILKITDRRALTVAANYGLGEVRDAGGKANARIVQYQQILRSIRQ
jgi:hypothetical protein